MKKLFTMLLLAAVSVAAMAEKELYGVYEGTTLTVYYDENRESREGFTQWWNYNIYSVQEAVFDASVAEARPNSLHMWFYKAHSLTTIKGLAYLNTSEVTNMAEMFNGCYSLKELDLSNFNTSKVTNMDGMFSMCQSLAELDLRNFDVSKVEYMGGMFFDCTNLQTIYCNKNWGASTALTDSERMFEGCESLQGGDAENPTAFNAEKTDAEYARPDKPSAGQPGYFTPTKGGKQWYGVLSGTTLTIYYDANRESKNGVLAWWNEESIASAAKEVNFDATVADARPFNTSNWFENFTQLTTISNLNRLNTSKVTDMSSMFRGCSSLTELDLRNFNVSKVADMSYMFYNCSNLMTIFCKDNWGASTVLTTSTDMFKGCVKLKGGDAKNPTAYNAEKTDAEYARPDKPAEGEPGYFTVGEQLYGVLNDTKLTINYDKNRASNDGVVEWWDDAVIATTTTEVIFDASVENATPANTTNWFYNFENLTTITGLDKVNTSEVTAMDSMFYGCQSLTSLDLSGLNTSNVTNMSAMFYGSGVTELKLDGFVTDKVTDMSYMFGSCSALTELDLSGFNTSNVTNMNYMFCFCMSLASLDITGFNTSNVTNMSAMFYGSGVTELKLDGFVTDKVTDMSYMFGSCSALTELDLSGFNTSKVTDMMGMFYYCISLPMVDCSKFNTENVTNMSYMFSGCQAMTSLDVSKLNTSNVTNMSSMFSGCKALKELDVSKFNTSKVTSMGGMFNGCEGLTSIDLSKFNTSNVTNMSYMFNGCKALKSLDMSKLNTGNVENMSYMFSGCEALTSLDMSSMSTSKVKDMSSMFSGCKALLKLDLSKFNTSSLKYMSSMFEGCEALTELRLDGFETGEVSKLSNLFSGCQALTSIDLSSFNTGNVTDMSAMFSGCKALKEMDLIDFDFSSIKYTRNMFNGCSELVTIYCNKDLSANTNLYYSTDMFKDCVKLKGGDAENPTAYDAEKVNKAYARPDDPAGGKPGYFTRGIELYGVLDGTTLTIYYDKNCASKGGVAEWWNDKDLRSKVTEVIFDASVADAQPTSTSNWFSNFSKLTTITNLDNLNTSKVTDMSRMFNCCSSLTGLDLSTFNTSKVTDMSEMFEYCTKLTSLDLSTFNTGKVTTMNNMFYQCYQLTEIKLSSFNTSNVTDMSKMFYQCHHVTSLDLGSFNTSNVTNMSGMFQECKNLTTLNISSFNTENVTSMQYMFSDCEALPSIDVTGFNTENVKNMWSMFGNCKALTELDVRNFNISNVYDMRYMFYNCSQLVTIRCNDDWGSSGTLEYSDGMFQDCYKLKGGNTESPTVYSYKWVDAEYARPDGWQGWRPGYFTKLIVKEKELYGALSGTTLTIYYDTERESNSGVLEWWKDANIPSTTEKVTFDASVADALPTSTSSWFANFQKLTAINGLTYLNTSEVTDMSGMFASCSKLTSLDLSNFNTSKVTDMKKMFMLCSALTSLNLSSFNTSKVMDMSSMFYDCGALTSLNISSFNTSKVTAMTNLFTNCRSLKSLDLSSFNTSNITDMTALFDGCQSLTTLDLSNFNTSKVTMMSSMFNSCLSLTSLDLSSFNTSEVKLMNNMFRECEALTSLDLSNFNTSKVTVMSSMFEWCKSLTSLDVSGFDISNVTNMSSMFHNCPNLETIYCSKDWGASETLTFSYDMFSGCTKLKGGNPASPTVYDSQKVNKEYAHPDGLDGKPGYFTYSELPTCKVQFIAENGKITSDPVVADLAHVTFGTVLVLTATPAEGYEFDKWTNYDGVKLVVTSDTTVTATFKIKTFTVTFVDKDENVLKTETVEYGKSATAPEAPAVEGYQFKGWDKEFTQVKENITVTAKYEINTYKVTLVAENGTITPKPVVDDADHVAYGTELVLTATPAEGYEFDKWTNYDGVKLVVISDTTVTASFKIKTLTVTFVGQDEQVLKTETVEYGKSATAPDAPAVEGFNFTGWDVSFDAVTSDLTVNAIYEEIIVVDYTPQNLKVEQAKVGEDTRITFSWDAVEGADSYEIELLYNGLPIFSTNTYTLHEIPVMLSEVLLLISGVEPGTYQLDWHVRSLDSKAAPLSDWAEGEQFEVEVPVLTGLEDTNTDATNVRKTFRNGRILIITSDGRTFDTNGRKVKGEK